MTTILLTFMILVSVVIVMAVGVLFGRQPIKGSCGGMAAIGMKNACDICGGDDQKCETESRRIAEQRAKASEATDTLAYEAVREDRR